jgi:hypothetical protein
MRVTGNPDVDRARAHLVRAEKYSAIGDDAKAGAHFRRALEYHRRSAKTKGQQFGMYDALVLSSVNAATLAGAAAAGGGLAAGAVGAYLGRDVLPMAYKAAKGAAEKVSSYISTYKPQTSGKEEAYAYSPTVDFSGGIGKKYGPKEEYNYGKQDGSFMDFGGNQDGSVFSARGRSRE